jgi:hypothetical protein
MDTMQMSTFSTDASTEVIDYQKLCAHFHDSMQTKMRGHGAEIDYLELWVPDPDIVRSITNMIDAAHEAGRTEIFIKVHRDSIVEAEIEKLKNLASASLVIVEQNDSLIFEFSELSAFSIDDDAVEDNAASSQAPRGDGHRGQKVQSVRLEQGVFQDVISELKSAVEHGLDSLTLSCPTFENDAQKSQFLGTLEAFGDIDGHQMPQAGLPITVSNMKDMANVSRLPLAFRRGVYKAAMTAEHEGRLDDDSLLICVNCEHDGIELGLHIHPENRRVRKAWFVGSQSFVMTGVMEVFCRVIEKLTFQDASDYSGFKLLHLLRDFRLARAKAGVNMSVNVEPIFNFPLSMVRMLHEKLTEYEQFQNTANFYEPPPSKEWVKSSHEFKVGQIENQLIEFALSRGLSDGDVIFGEISKNTLGFPIRVTVSFSPNLDRTRLATLTLQLERWLKDKIEDKIQVFCDEFKDQSKLRRMADDSINKFK